jgi:hypothetical protein
MSQRGSRFGGGLGWVALVLLALFGLVGLGALDAALHNPQGFAP